jgi:hypothetical protein
MDKDRKQTLMGVAILVLLTTVVVGKQAWRLSHREDFAFFSSTTLIELVPYVVAGVILVLVLIGLDMFRRRGAKSE